MKKYIFDSIHKELNKKPRILITTHRSPDGDAMGSSLALYQVLVKQGFEVSVVVPNSYPKFLHWLPCNKEVVEYEGNEKNANTRIDSAELIFCLDFNDLGRTDMMSESLQNSTATFVMIDHHQDPSDFADIMFSVPGISSTAQLVYEFIENMGWSSLLTQDIAECIYTGLITDTGSFRFSSVDARTHEIASKLIEVGLKQAHIHQRLFDNNKESRLKLLGYCLSEKLEVLPEYKTAVMSLSQEELDRFHFVKGDTEGFVNYALSIDGVIFTAFFVQNENKVKISFRSLNDFRANLLSKKHFSGGGHINAAGGVHEGSLDEAIRKFKTILPDYKDELSANC
ncbi:bifunctional oligoribonuclease/PAP phosphatase NrnA [Flavobacteriales bacterium]|nr:bifunctional oligoribonuclease/PAP phosphatase NrnA [Flavobacteriales bacterium]